jgi:hypothetical protein
MASKADYVKREAREGHQGHHCHGGMPGCKGTCPPAMWGCRSCWFKLPKHLRDKVWAAYRPGQERDKSPSREYVAVAREVQAWIKTNYPEAAS